MKNIRLILIITLLLTVVSYTQGQELQLMFVHKNGNISYASNLSTSDSITFSKFSVPTGSTGVLINGVVWATCNVDAPGAFVANPSDAGMFYQWNRRVGWSSTDPLKNNLGGTTWNPDNPTGYSWSEANDPCPAGWRVPTAVEVQLLINSGSFWGELNGVKGRFFGNGNQRVFLSAAGCRVSSDGSLFDVGARGYFWSSTPDSGEYANYLYFYSGKVGADNNNRTLGFSVRCVKK